MSCGLTVTSETGGSELWAHCDYSETGGSELWAHCEK